MKLSPLDIRKQEFGRVWRGYDVDEVNTFLEMMADEFETLAREDSNLRERLSTLEETVQDYQKMERALQETLMHTQQIAEEVKRNAQKEAELIIREAELKGRRATEDIYRQVSNLKAELSDLKNLRASYIAELRSMIDAQRHFLESLEQEDDELSISSRFRRELKQESVQETDQ